MIWRNFRRELVYATSRLLSVVVITAVAVLMQVGLSGVAYNGDRIVGEYFEKQNVADYWITGIGLDRADAGKLQRIKGVRALQPRIVADVEARYDEGVTLTLYGIADGYHINTPLILEGGFPKDSREIMLSARFAKKHGLTVGDSYDMKVKGTGTILRKQICALVKSPECMYHTNATSLAPDFNAYGFAYMNEEALWELFGKNTYNQICITTEDGADDAAMKAEINGALGNKLVNALALKDYRNAYNLVELLDSLKPIFTVFPLLFFLVAILIMFSTMSRLIGNARMSIGTLKALGYSDGVILAYYLLYSVFVVLLGFLIGALPANGLLTRLVIHTMFALFDVPPYQVLPALSSLAASFLLTCVFCIGTAFLVTAGALRERPAACMRPKPPKAVKALLIENIPALWRRLRFSKKYIIRNIFRNKARMAICIIGVTGCMTLVFGAFAIRDSIKDYAQMLVGGEHRYDFVLHLKAGVTKGEYNRIALLGGVTDTQYEMVTSAKIFSSGRQEAAVFTVAEDSVRLKLPGAFIPPPCILPADGLMLEDALAKKLGYRAGDIATIKFAGDNQYYRMRIASVSGDIFGVYAGKSYWRGFGKGYTPTAVYVKATDGNTFKEQASGLEFIASLKTREDVTDELISQQAALSMIIYLLILFGGVLALVVLYNLGIMSFYDQIRHLATLMVLGFHDKETRTLLLTENIVFTCTGIIAGLPLGLLLAKGIITAISGMFAFRLTVSPVSYLLSSFITMSFAIIVNRLLSRKMSAIDMLGALKSVE